MTTVIMISNDNSVIITNSETAETPRGSEKTKWSPDSGSGESPQLRTPVKETRSHGECSRKLYPIPRKLSVSTLESDSEELNHSSSSTTSTLSSRTSGVSSGATSGSGGSNPSYWHHPGPAQHQDQRKFTTLNRNPQKSKINPILRTRSFQVSQQKVNKPSSFSPSENSAFHCISASQGSSKDLSQFQASKFVTSTPVKSEPRGGRRRAGHMRNVFPPPVTGGPGVATGALSALATGGDNVDRQLLHTDFYALTRSLGRQPRAGHVSHVTGGQQDMSHHPAFRHLMPGTRGRQVSPINTHYTKIYSGLTEAALERVERETVSSDSDYDTIYSSKDDSNTLVPIGSVFPSGCHRHPARLMPSRPALPSCLPSASAAQLLSYRYNLDMAERENRENSSLHTLSSHLSQFRPVPNHFQSLSENSSETDSMTRTRTGRLLPDIINKSEMAAKAKSFDGLVGLLNKNSFRENKENNKSKISFNESFVPRRQKLRISQANTGSGGSKFGGLSVSRAQILRRHTLHEKASSSHTGQSAGHVHSWHKQDDEQQRSKSSSLKRSVSRRSSSSSRLSLLSRKDDIEISITDTQSLDRLSLHSQEDLDGINIEKYLQTAGRAAGWAKEFDCLLSDKIGLGKFTDFLQKEFSHENIFFWSACERYRLLDAGPDRLRLAKEILQRHLELGAVEPVNVDSAARAATRHKVAMASIETPPESNVFLSAQRQIYNLMKFDSYTRFLKSDVYKDCIRAEMSGSSSGSGATAGSELSGVARALDSGAERIRESDLPRQRRADSLKTKRRKSMSFWEHWSKSRDPAAEQSCQDSGVTPSRGAGPVCTLTRVIFPDQATTVVTTNTGESIRALVSRLLEKRNMRLTSFDVFLTAGGEAGAALRPLDLSEDCAILHCAEVRVESRILFRLELPSHKSIGVKAKQTKTVRDVLAPILQQYGWNINEVDVYVDEDTTIAGAGDDKVDLVSNVAVIDNKRLFLVQKSLEEIQKAESDGPGKGDGDKAGPAAPEIESSELTLYEGLQIMRKGRFEDQRGTEICFEIPEFLRLPENNSGGSPDVAAV